MYGEEQAETLSRARGGQRLQGQKKWGLQMRTPAQEQSLLRESQESPRPLWSSQCTYPSASKRPTLLVQICCQAKQSGSCSAHRLL